MPTPSDQDRPHRLLITAGPTHEPIDAVRYLGNRSSGRLGVALADAAAKRGIDVRILIGPTPARPAESGVDVVPFRSTADLQKLLDDHLDWCDTLVMAAAVSDYRPIVTDEELQGKRRRGVEPMRLVLEPTPDLLAGCARRRRPDQLLVGFALEPRERLISSATRKLSRKRIDAIVANPLETMDAGSIEAMLMVPCTDEPAPGSEPQARLFAQTDGAVPKTDFGPWLLDRIDELADLPKPWLDSWMRDGAPTRA